MSTRLESSLDDDSDEVTLVPSSLSKASSTSDLSSSRKVEMLKKPVKPFGARGKRQLFNGQDEDHDESYQDLVHLDFLILFYLPP
jgi:hypothetical protein